MAPHLSGLAEGGPVAGLQPLPQRQQQVAGRVKLEHLVEAHVREPHKAPLVDGDHVRHEEHALPPAGEHLAYNDACTPLAALMLKRAPDTTRASPQLPQRSASQPNADLMHCTTSSCSDATGNLGGQSLQAGQRRAILPFH